MVAKKQRELDDALGDIQRRRETERELRIQVKDLTTTCDGLERRLRASGRGYVRPVSRPVSRPTSRSNSVERSYQRPWAERQPAHHRPPVGRNASNTGGFRTPASGTTPTRGRSPSSGAYRSAGVRDAASPSTRGRDRTPRSPRFDPTAYVQEKRQREEARFMSSARGLASGAASPARERERGTHGGYSREASPAPGRHGRSPSPGGGGVNSGFGGGASRGPWASSSPGRRKSNENQAPVGSNATRNATATTGRATTRSASPGRVLRDVQRRLVSVVASDGTGSKSTDATSAKPKRRPSNSSHGLLTDDSQLRRPKEHASSEIADIDSRLAALQMFLREAKQVGSPREKEAA
jgi:coiled-coil domain-containing protein 61